MDEILKIFTQLGVDFSIFYQIALVIVLFFLLNFVLFNPLKNVLVERDEKTNVLDQKANDMLNKAEELKKEFNQKLNHVQDQALTDLKKKKQKLYKEEETQVKAKEREIIEYTDKNRDEFMNMLSSRKDKILNESDKLSEKLVEKIVH